VLKCCRSFHAFRINLASRSDKQSIQHQNTKVSPLTSPRAQQFHRTERLHPPGHTVTAAVLRATIKETRTCREGPEGEWRYSSVLYATGTPSWNNEPRRLTPLRKLPVSLIFFCEHKDEKWYAIIHKYWNYSETYIHTYIHTYITHTHTHTHTHTRSRMPLVQFSLRIPNEAC
jgi:hypothetical protein